MTKEAENRLNDVDYIDSKIKALSAVRDSNEYPEQTIRYHLSQELNDYSFKAINRLLEIRRMITHNENGKARDDR